MKMMGDFNLQIRRKKVKSYENSKFGLELRNEIGDTLVEWATSRKYKIMNTTIQKKAMKDEIDYILTNRPDIITYVTVINQVNTGSAHRTAMSNIKLDVEEERNTRPPAVDATQIETKKIEFQLELRNQFETLQ